MVLSVVLLLSVALPAQADDLAAAANAARGQALPVDGVVDAFAQRAAERMAGAQSLVHSDLSGLFGSCSAVGEVIGYGPDVTSVMAAFVASPGHWSTISQPGWTAMGTGQTRDSGGVLWVAVVFCTLLQTPSPPPPTTAPPPTTKAPPPQSVPDEGPIVRSAQRELLIHVRIGPTWVEGTSLFLGASPFLDQGEWPQLRIPSVS